MPDSNKPWNSFEGAPPTARFMIVTRGIEKGCAPYFSYRIVYWDGVTLHEDVTGKQYTWQHHPYERWSNIPGF